MNALQLRSVLESVGVGIIACDPDGQLLSANDVARGFAGAHGVTALLGGSAVGGVFEPSTGALLPAADLPLVRAREGGVAHDVSFVVRNDEVPEGRFLCGCGWPLRAADGRAVGAVMALREPDRTAQAEVRKHRWFLESIIEHVPAMIFVKEARELRFERFNREGEALLGMSREALLGKNDYDMFPRSQADFFTARDRETLARGAILDIPEEPIQTTHGERWLHTRKVPILDDGGQPAYLLGISEDITERKAAVEALRAAREELEQRVHERTRELERTNAELRLEIEVRQKAELALSVSEAQLRQAQKMEAVGRLAGGVAHDFNNMLTAILSFGRIVQGEMPPDGPLRPEMGQIIAAAERAAALTKHLLAFSRQQVLQPTILDLATIVRGMDAMLRRIIGEDVRLQTITAPALAHVLADPGQIEQVVLNLALNARDAMPGGGAITIEVANVHLTAAVSGSHGAIAAGDYVMLAVSDTGEGMAPATLGRVFEPFFTTKPHGQGTGLGLSTCYGIVKQSGGEITAYSEIGHGTVFKIYLPRADGVQRAEAPKPAPAALPGAGRTVLLVEDEPLVRAAARRILGSRGYHVMEAFDADDALAKEAQHAGVIDVLLSDVVMPGLNGRELADRLVVLRPHMKVVFMSGYAEHGAVKQGLLAGGASFISKPYTPDGLLRKIDEALGDTGEST